MFIVVQAKRIFWILCLTIAAISGMIIVSNRTLVPVFRSEGAAASRPCYIIDAGHGGEDGGAVAQDGTIESTLNLSIARKLEGVLAFAGKRTAMTRSDENAVYSAGADTLREKKRSDLENRVKMVQQYDAAYLISIHQNSLPSVPSVHGAQVFFNTQAGADILAETVQEHLNQTINAGNEKDAKQITSTIYLMQQADCPAILIECGFLSNQEETQKLQDEAYQTQLAVVIASGVLSNTNGENSNEK